MSSLLEIDSITKLYNNSRILTDICLKCKTGDIIGILGRNGSGKSTLLKIIFGVEPAENRFIRIDGIVYSCPYKAKDLLCYLPQHKFIPKYLTVEKVVNLYLDRSGSKSFLNDTFLEKIKKSKIDHLSGGELKYLEVKLLIKTNSKFLLLDEPFSGVSPILTEHIKELLIEASKTKGIILTDHDYRNVLHLASQYWLIINGGLRQINNKEQLIGLGYLPP
jgi:ABC-type lipopolysaccharide export system ATPase subunit